MPITKYKLISVTTDSFQGASWVDVRVYMAGAQPKPRQIYVAPRRCLWPKWRLVQIWQRIYTLARRRRGVIPRTTRTMRRRGVPTDDALKPEYTKQSQLMNTSKGCRGWPCTKTWIHKTMSTSDVLQKTVVGNKTQYWVVSVSLTVFTV